MKKFKVCIEGNTPVIYNRMKREIEQAKKLLKKDQMAEWEEKNWMEKAEINNGNAIIPTEWIRGMLLNSTKQTKLNPYFATTKNATWSRYFQNVYIFHKPPILLCKKTELTSIAGFYPSHGAKKNCGKIWKVFPKCDKWKIEFTIVDPFGRLRKTDLKELVEYGGMYVCIGDQRPMNFGRFDVKSIEEVKNERY